MIAATLSVDPLAYELYFFSTFKFRRVEISFALLPQAKTRLDKAHRDSDSTRDEVVLQTPSSGRFALVGRTWHVDEGG